MKGSDAAAASAAPGEAALEAMNPNDEETGPSLGAALVVTVAGWEDTPRTEATPGEAKKSNALMVVAAVEADSAACCCCCCFKDKPPNKDCSPALVPLPEAAVGVLFPDDEDADLFNPSEEEIDPTPEANHPPLPLGDGGGWVALFVLSCPPPVCGDPRAAPRGCDML